MEVVDLHLLSWWLDLQILTWPLDFGLGGTLAERELILGVLCSDHSVQGKHFAGGDEKGGVLVKDFED